MRNKTERRRRRINKRTFHQLSSPAKIKRKDILLMKPTLLVGNVLKEKISFADEANGEMCFHCFSFLLSVSFLKFFSYRLHLINRFLSSHSRL